MCVSRKYGFYLYESICTTGCDIKYQQHSFIASADNMANTFHSFTPKHSIGGTVLVLSVGLYDAGIAVRNGDWVFVAFVKVVKSVRYSQYIAAAIARVSTHSINSCISFSCCWQKEHYIPVYLPGCLGHVFKHHWVQFSLQKAIIHFVEIWYMVSEKQSVQTALQSKLCSHMALIFTRTLLSFTAGPVPDVWTLLQCRIKPQTRVLMNIVSYNQLMKQRGSQEHTVTFY